MDKIVLLLSDQCWWQLVSIFLAFVGASKGHEHVACIALHGGKNVKMTMFLSCIC